MLITGRGARAVLEEAGVSTRLARTALSCGLAGEAVRTTAAHLYDEARVRELATRPVIRGGAFLDACPQGYFIARREIQVAVPREELIRQVAHGWTSVGMWTWTFLGLRVQRLGRVPFVATVAGFIVLGADIIDLEPGCGLTLAPPGAWFEPFESGRLPMGRGQSWVING